MHRVVLGLGSNLQPQRHLTTALQHLCAQFEHIDISPVYETQAVGFDGPNFWNLIVGIQTDLLLEPLKTRLRAIEYDLGRPPQAQKWADRCIDIDILIFGDLVGATCVGKLPRADILKYAHVLAPLADLYPQLCHCETGTSFADHWRTFSGDSSGLIQTLHNSVLLAGNQ